MDTASLIDQSLELAVARIGDPAPRVYARLFAQQPELETLFVNDRSGSVRAEMFLKSLDVVQDLLAGNLYAQGLLSTEWVNHRNLGVPMERFALFYRCLVETLREALGDEWTPAFEAAWRDALARLEAVIEAAAAESG